jgi:hypothetical protein
VYCSRFVRDLNLPGFQCTAFPDKIPDKIIDNRADHREPIEGDHGMRFKQDPTVPRLDAALYDEILKPA